MKSGCISTSLYPLGFRYVLDLTHLKPDYPIATMNETLAKLVSDEIAGTVLARYYSPAGWAGTCEYHSETFDFNREMRQIRLRVDGAAGGRAGRTCRGIYARTPRFPGATRLLYP